MNRIEWSRRSVGFVRSTVPITALAFGAAVLLAACKRNVPEPPFQGPTPTAEVNTCATGAGQAQGDPDVQAILEHAHVEDARSLLPACPGETVKLAVVDFVFGGGAHGDYVATFAGGSLPNPMGLPVVAPGSTVFKIDVNGYRNDAALNGDYCLGASVLGRHLPWDDVDADLCQQDEYIGKAAYRAFQTAVASGAEIIVSGAATYGRDWPRLKSLPNGIALTAAHAARILNEIVAPFVAGGGTVVLPSNWVTASVAEDPAVAAAAASSGAIIVSWVDPAVTLGSDTFGMDCDGPGDDEDRQCPRLHANLAVAHTALGANSRTAPAVAGTVALMRRAAKLAGRGLSGAEVLTMLASPNRKGHILHSTSTSVTNGPSSQPFAYDVPQLDALCAVRRAQGLACDAGELVKNGTFDVDIAGWSNDGARCWGVASPSALAWDPGGEAPGRLKQYWDASWECGWAQQVVAVPVPGTYRLTAEYRRLPGGVCEGTWPSPWVEIGGASRLSWAPTDEAVKSVDIALSPGSSQLALATSMINQAGCVFGYWDNVSLRYVGP